MCVYEQRKDYGKYIVLAHCCLLLLLLLALWFLLLLSCFYLFSLRFCNCTNYQLGERKTCGTRMRRHLLTVLYYPEFTRRPIRIYECACVSTRQKHLKSGVWMERSIPAGMWCVASSCEISLLHERRVEWISNFFRLYYFYSLVLILCCYMFTEFLRSFICSSM